MSRAFAALLLFALAAASQAAPPTKVQATYNVLKFGMRVVAMSETFTRTNDRYRIESVNEAIGLAALIKPEVIRVVSEGAVTEQGLRPDIFTITRKVDAHLNARADFDWARHQITLTDHKGKRTLPLKPATQDRLSAMYQFLFLPVQDMKELKFDMTNGNKLDAYSFILTPGQSVTVPLGTLRATYVVTAPEPGATRTEAWLATERANVPCKMVITDPDGSKTTQVLTKLELAP